MSRWPLTARGTGAAVLAFACFVGAHAFTLIELLYISALLTIVVIASIATLYFVRRAEKVTRSFDPDIAGVGDEVDVRLRVEIRSPLPSAQGQWSDILPVGIEGDAAGVFPQTGSGMWTGSRAVALQYTARATRRGIRPIGPVSVVSTDPFGFARRRHSIGRALPLTVTPAIVDLSPLAELPGEAGGSMHSATDQLGEGSDNLVPRHYIPGDSMRRIHWRASAHRDQLMVRQEEQETTPEATVVLDRARARWHADADRAPGTDPSFEMAVSACVSVAARLVHEGYIVGVVEADGTPLTDTIDAGDAAGVERLAIDLATVTARRDGGFESLVAMFAGTSTGPVVVITGAMTEADATVLAPLAHHSSLPIVLAVAPQGAAFVQAAESGWRTAQIPPSSDLGVAWATVTERGARRVRT
jgi:uncharacterized protein (DUF58 family)